MKRASLFLFVLVAAGNAGPPLGAADRSDERDILEAVFRQQVAELLDDETRARGVVLCLAHDPGDAPQSVDKELLVRFKGEASVRRAAECEVRAGRVAEIATGRPGVLVTAGPIETVAADEAWVTVVQRWSRGHSYKKAYRVVREPARWISLGPIFKGSPS